MLKIYSSLTISAWFLHCAYLYPKINVSSSKSQKSLQSFGIGTLLMQNKNIQAKVK